MTFDNHAPINFNNATEIASASRDGGAYSGIGHDTVSIMQGKNMIHVYRDYSSGCVSHGRHSAPNPVTYLFGARTKEEIIAWLIQQLPKSRTSEPAFPDPDENLWAANELLEALGYEGVEA